MRTTIAVGLILTSGLFAQTRSQTQNQARSQTRTIDMAKQLVVEGSISAINLAYGTQYPSALVNGRLVKLAPVAFLLDNGMELRAGDPVTMAVAGSSDPADPYLYALRIMNRRSGADLQLRGATGVPLWSGAGNGTGPKASQPGCLDPASSITVSGTVVSATYGTGIEMPLLVLQTADGSLLSIKIGPERTLTAADVELSPGLAITVTALHSTCYDEYVALQLVLPDGTVVTLRDSTGRPAWPGTN